MLEALCAIMATDGFVALALAVPAMVLGIVITRSATSVHRLPYEQKMFELRDAAERRLLEAGRVLKEEVDQ